ncbi:MAG TPA: secretin N-terminal domain-containing protein [Rhabdochlamydiaceae bacterium]|nr:secretin N-terminal domain-containing protein [Rhabdochlamydiaceae bacterium]
MSKKIIKLLFLIFIISTAHVSAADEDACEVDAEVEVESKVEPGGEHQIDFKDVSMIELIRFVSKISQVNFIFNHEELEFNVSLSSGKPVNAGEVLQALIQTLRVHGFGVSEEENYFVIYPLGRESGKSNLSADKLIAGPIMGSRSSSSALDFFVYKLKYHQGNDLEETLKKIAGDLKARPDHPQKLIEAIQTIHWVKSTNSLLFSGDEETLTRLKGLIGTLDIPLRQVFIEVLVVETDARNSMEFGLQWVGGGNYRNRVGFGMGNFPAHGGDPPLANAVAGLSPSCPPTGLNQIPVGRGFDLGVIGDLIFHKGKSFVSLGSLVSALQMDGDTTIVLNQKIITQDNKNSTIFVGDNIPFTGSVVQTIGPSQQTTANIEYRDIGVSLSITPMLGEGEIITLDIDQEITEAVDHAFPTTSTQVEGIRTTKTNMATHVHVPDNHFLVLSGMIRNSKSYQKSGLPCLGGLPYIGAAFSKTRKINEKRNILIFVRPHIINSFEDYDKVTDAQEKYYDTNYFNAQS